MPSNERTLIRAVVGLLRGTSPKAGLPRGRSGRARTAPPIVRLVFPGRLDANPRE